MNGKEGKKNWEVLFEKAVFLLERSGFKREEWDLGGGTSLMVRYMHRVSRDIDIFLKDIQKLTYLTPRLNDIALSLTDEYEEAANFIKLHFRGKGEIDFIVAPNLTGLPSQKKNILNTEVFVDDPVEVVIKKLFYRAESLKVRDVIDTAVVFKHEEEKFKHFFEKVVVPCKFPVLQDRWNFLKRRFNAEVQHLVVLDSSLVEFSKKCFESLLKKCSCLN